MATIAKLLTGVVKKAAIESGIIDASVLIEEAVPAKNPEHGDYQSNAAFRLAKVARTSPREVAQRIVEVISSDEMIAEASVAGPGFINFRLSDAWLSSDLQQRLTDPKFGTPQVENGQTVVIDYSSPNVAKRMHIGHIRSTLIGNALYRMHQFLGWTAIGDNHIGDWGTQFGILILAWQRWRDDAAYEADPIGELQRIYQAFGPASEAEPGLRDQAKVEVAKLQAGDHENRELWRKFVTASLSEFDQIYDRLDVKFDVTLGESFYRDQLRELVDDLMERGIARVIDGAVQIPFGPKDGKGMSKKPMVIQKSDGAALYGTTDLATVNYRISEWNPARMVYVTDSRQKLHFQQLFAAVKKSGIERELVHVQFGMLRFADGAVASTRAGNVINLVDLLDTAVTRARAVVDEKSASFSEEERASIAETVGLAAIKYADLSQNPVSDVLFDWDRMLSLEGNTAPYLLYAYARSRSIVRKAMEEGATVGRISIHHSSERKLALMLLRTPEVLVDSVATYRPNLLCDHLYNVATAFAGFYRDCRVRGEVADVTSARLALVEATAMVMRIGLGNLGIKALERM